MAKKNIIAVGTRVALSANFLRNTGQQTGPAGSRRGVVLSIMDNIFVRVRWDEATDYIALAMQWGDDYADDVKAHGHMVNVNNLAAVGSIAMSKYRIGTLGSARHPAS